MSQLQTLFQALRAGDLAAARVAAEGIAAERERQGHVSAARTLRSALRADGHTLLAPPSAPTPGDAPEALARVALGVGFDDVELPATVRAKLDEIVLESRHAAELAALGVPRRSRILLAGPPGCGKSLTARALGAALGLPVYVVRLDAIVGALLGQTSSRLHAVFRFAERTPCVLLLDEVDALGRRRGERLDVAELDRVVVGLMQELDYAHLAGVLVATTNFVEAIDPALRRRFELELELPLPDAKQRRGFIKRRSVALGLTIPPATVEAQLGKRPSYAEMERVVLDLARQRLLAELEAKTVPVLTRGGRQKPG